MLRLREECSDSGRDAQTQRGMLRLREGCSDSGRNAQTQGGMLRLRVECSDSGRDAQTQGGMLRLREECSDLEWDAQTQRGGKAKSATSCGNAFLTHVLWASAVSVLCSRGGSARSPRKAKCISAAVF